MISSSRCLRRSLCSRWCWARASSSRLPLRSSSLCSLPSSADSRCLPAGHATQLLRLPLSVNVDFSRCAGIEERGEDYTTCRRLLLFRLDGESKSNLRFACGTLRLSSGSSSIDSSSVAVPPSSTDISLSSGQSPGAGPGWLEQF